MSLPLRVGNIARASSSTRKPIESETFDFQILTGESYSEKYHIKELIFHENLNSKRN